VMRQVREGHVRAVPGDFRDPLAFRRHEIKSRRTWHVSLQRLVKWRPLTSPGSLEMVPPVPRYYEALRSPDSHRAALRFLRLAIPRSDCISSPFGHSRPADGSSRSLWYRLLPIRLPSRNYQDLPSSRGTLVTMRPVLRPRRDRIRGRGPIVNGSDMAPASNHDGGSPRSARFRGSMARHLVWLSTPRSEGLALPRARLASGRWSQLYRAGFEPAGFQ
jgi:hypothetical protein